jgi:3'(2'), 5'-bisphosphate nucleotidase
MNFTDLQDMSKKIVQIVAEAGKIILLEKQSKSFEIVYKEDKTAVTTADLKSNDYIIKKLESLYPSIPIISEETKEKDTQGSDYFWLVDPLDGTKAYIDGKNYFTVLVALIFKSKVIMGVVGKPSESTVYSGVSFEDRSEAYKYENGHPPIRIQCRIPSTEGVDVLLGTIPTDPEEKQKFNEYLSKNDIRSTHCVGGMIKFCMIAEGKADVHLRGSGNLTTANTSEWDIAAGHGVLKAAGGNVFTWEGEELYYGKKDWKNWGGYIALGKVTNTKG